MLNTYKITFSIYRIVDGKISNQNHFSNCHATIEGETFDEAVRKFAEEERQKGWIVMGVVEGDLFTVTFFDLDKT